MEIRDKMIESTKEIFSSMVMMEITVKEVMADHGPLHDTITGMIGLAGTHKGVLAVGELGEWSNAHTGLSRALVRVAAAEIDRYERG